MNSISPARSDIIPTQEIKKIKKEEKDGVGHQSDGEKSDQDLVVDDACSEDINLSSPVTASSQSHPPHNGTPISPRENGILIKKAEHLNERNLAPNSPRSSSSDRGSSSNGSTTPSNTKLKLEDKPLTPGVNGNGGIPKSIVSKAPAAYPPGYMNPINGSPHDLQAAAAYAAVLPPGHPGFRGLSMGFDSQMRAPSIGPNMSGKP
jgi:groucho